MARFEAVSALYLSDCGRARGRWTPVWRAWAVAAVGAGNVEAKWIRITGARQHNLQNISLDLPREKLIVLTGVSGSGKSSLAFDTLYAEGQRKYVESLSVHARHFLEQLGKPDVDRIEGLPPTLAIEQRAAAANPRSIVATTTEIYDFLRLLFARVGTPHCPHCGRPVRSHTVDQVVDAVLGQSGGSRLLVLAPLVRGRRGDHQAVVRRIQREGFVRARVNGRLCEVKELAGLPQTRKLDIDVVVDRLVVKPEIRARLADAVEIAYTLGDGTAIISRSDGQAPQPEGEVWVDQTFSQKYACTTCGVALPELSPRAFSFNSPYGACEQCGGLGTRLHFDEQLIVPDEELSLAGGAIAPWAGGQTQIAANYRRILKKLCAAFEVKPETPFKNLPEDLRRIVLHGTRPADVQEYGVEFEGVIPSLQRRCRSAGGEGARGRFAAYQSEHVCEGCGGARLRPGPLAVRIEGRNIHDVIRMPIEQATRFFDELHLPGEPGLIADPILREAVSYTHLTLPTIYSV